MDNAYAAPAADLNVAAPQQTYEPRVFALSGRIGRLRYLAYATGLTVALMPLYWLFVLTGNPVLAGIGIIPLWIFMMGISFVMAVRRLNDMDMSGWLSLLLLVPFVNMIMGLVLACRAGSEGANSYGPAPCENSTAVKVIACIVPAIFVLGIFAAVAIPAYQAYALRAQMGVQAR